MADESIVKFPDMLRIKGVMAKGYGIICKFPMTDPELGIYAKAIYALLCSYSGNGTAACPSRKKIMELIPLGRKAYDSGIKQLQEQGYVSIKKNNTQANGQFSHNIYTLESNPKKFADSKYSSNGGTLSSTFSFSGIKRAGYGMIPRSVMIDPRLTPTAKVIYAYLASFSGAGKVAFPEVKNIQYHLGIGRTAYFSHMKKLTETNYITAVQRHENGKLGVNDYWLNDNPDESSVAPLEQRRKTKRVVVTGAEGQVSQSAAKEHSVQSAGKEHTAKVHPAAEHTDKEPSARETPVREHTVGEITAQETIIKNSSLINSSLSISHSINKVSTHWTDGMSWGEIIDYIECKLDPDETCAVMNIPLSRENYDFIAQVIADFLCSDRKKLRIRGVEHDRGDVIDKLLALDLYDYAYIIDKIKSVEGTIKNVRSYCLVCLYSAKEDHNIELSRQITQDFKHG